jgi:hypothetical protein
MLPVRILALPLVKIRHKNNMKLDRFNGERPLLFVRRDKNRWLPTLEFFYPKTDNQADHITDEKNKSCRQPLYAACSERVQMGYCCTLAIF